MSDFILAKSKEVIETLPHIKIENWCDTCRYHEFVVIRHYDILECYSAVVDFFKTAHRHPIRTECTDVGLQTELLLVFQELPY